MKIMKIKNKSILKKFAIVCIIFLGIYFLYFLYKLSFLLFFLNKINSISDYENYSIMMSWQTKDNEQGIIADFNEYDTYAKNIHKIETYSSTYDFPINIVYTNEQKDEVYILDYDEEKQKYILYDNYLDDEILVDTINSKNAIKDLTYDIFPHGLELFFSSINPNVFVYLDNDNLAIKYANIDQNNSYVVIYLNKVTGILNKMETSSSQGRVVVTYDYLFSSLPGYDYDSLNSFNINDYDYILNSQIEES